MEKKYNFLEGLKPKNEVKLGIIEISSNLKPSEFDVEMHRYLFREFVPLRMISDFNESMPISVVNRWICFHEDFDEVPEGEMIPTYLPTFKREKDGKVELVKIEKVDGKNKRWC